MYGQPDKKGSVDSSISGLYSLLTDEKTMNGDVFPGNMETLASDTQRAEVRQGLYRKLHGRGIFTGSYEDFDNYFFNPYSQGNQVEALRNKIFTQDPAKELARRRAISDASRGQYNPFGTSEVSYRPEVRGLGTNIAPIDLVDSEDTQPEPKTPAGDLPKTTRTFWGGVVSGARGIHGGAQIAVADLLKGFGGNSDDEKEAIHLINQMEQDGTLSLERVRGVREKLLKDLDSYTNSDIRFSGDYSKKARQADALKLIEERMQRMGEDLSPEKRAVALDAMRSDLREKGAGEDKANPFVRWKEGAKDYMRKSEVPEGTWAELGSATASVGGALAGQAISMIPGAAPIGQAISWASIGAQTISSGGQAIMDMEDYAAEKGVYISPEDKATIALGYMATEFGGDALGGAVASKSISAIGKLAGGRIGQKLAVRSLAKGIAGNEGVRQSLSSLSEYAQKPLAIPLAKSAGRQIVRGAVTEGPGESLTTLMQNGALDRVWKDKEDQEAWADVARQAVKDGIYGAWAGALMGGFGSAIQSGQVAHMHRKEGLTLVQDEKNNLYEVIGSDQSSYLVLDRAGRQKMLPADQVVDAIHYTPQERQKSQKAYDEATEGLHPKEEVLTENQKQAGAILSATEQQQSPIYRATHPEVTEEDLNSPAALAGAKKALADVLEGQNEVVRARVDQMALVLRDGQADPTEELTKLFSDESLSDNDRQSILDVVTVQSRLAAIERSHQETMTQMQSELTKEWSAKSVVGDETARGAVISATITDADGKPKQVYVTGGVRVVTNENGTVELLPTDDDAPIYVYDESVEGDEKGHIVQMDDLSSPQLVAEDYLDLVQASIDEAETAFRSEVQAAEGQLSQEQAPQGEQGEGTIRTPNGRSFPVISGEDALSEIEMITSERSDEAPSLPEPIVESADFDKEFGAPVETPISTVTVGRGAFYKMVQNGRTELSGAIKPTLTDPDYIVKDGDTFLYVKLYRNSSGDMVRNIVAVEKTDGELHYLASIHPKTDSNLKNKIKSGGLLIDHLSIREEKGEQPQGLQSELPTDLYGKGTEKSEGEQFLSSLPRTREGEVDGLKLMSERPDDFIRYLGQLYGEDFVASLPLSKKGVLDLKALTPEQTLRVNEAALGKSGAVEAARQRRSKVGAERSKLEAEVKNDLGNLEKRMALRKASEEYRLYDDYVRTAEEQARQEREAQRRAEEAALTPEERQRREEEKQQLAQEKKEREERIRLENERRRREREELERNAEGSTVREYTEDPPRQARARDARLVNGAVVYRQEPMTVEHYVDAERAFSQRPGETRVPVKRTIVEAESLQASHKEGRMNPRHFIPEAQPKDRADNGLSSTAADRIASDIRPDEITGGITAYTGAPVVNGRGEVIQGNNRTDALQTMYDGEERHAKSAELYKEYLKTHASEYGMTAEQVDAMAHPVAVDVAEVSDSEAIRLGHRGQTDLESAGADTMNAQTVGEELNSDTDPQSGQSMLVSFFNRIFSRTGANGIELSEKMDNMLNRNAEEGLQFLHEHGYITDTQYKNAFETNSEGKRVVTAEAKTALKDVALYQLADVIGPRAMDIFYRLPASARNGLATFLYRDSQASFETSLAPDLGDALLVWDSLRQDPDFAGLTTFESAKIFILGKVSLFGRSELETNLGEASSLAKLLAASLQTQTEEQIAGALNQYYDLVGANETGAKTQSLMPTSQPTDTKAGAAEAVYGRVYEVPSGREKHYRFRRDVAEDFRTRRDALADRITEERRKHAAAMDMARTFGIPPKLHEDMSTLPEEVRAGFDETHFVKGWFYKGDNAIHIYLPANVDADDVRATFLHEAVGHYGCRELLGEVGYNQVLDGIANKLGEEEVLRAMEEYCNGSQDIANREQVRIAMDEWIAHRAESGITKKTVWESIKDFFRNVFGLSGKQIDQSAEMMADDLLRRSAKNLQKRAERQQGVATEVSPELSPERSEVRFRSNRSAADFARLRDAAIEQKGLVAPGLKQSSVKVTPVRRHNFTGTGLQAIEKARAWAKHRIVKDHWYHKGKSDGFKYLIDENGIGKFLSGSSTKNSDNLGLHLAILKKLPRIIDESILAETHADYRKVDGKRSPENGVDKPTMLVHRLYGAVKMNGELYRVKTTLHERYNADDRAYDYMVTSVELVISGSSTSDALTNSTRKSLKDIAVAKLLKGVEKSYDPGKQLLDESASSGLEEQTSRFRRAERDEIRSRAIEDGTWMKAPNGEKSNLSERDWVTVRTKAFKDWYGDWETYDDGLLDENYEPRVFYHRSPKAFTEFSREAIGSKTDPGFLGRGFYFFSDPQEGDGYGNNTYPVFLKMKYPYYAENEDVSMLAEAYSSKASSDFTERLKSEGYDGVIYTGDLREELMVFDPEQIKSAIGNAGTFDGTNPDIRYRKAHLAGVHTLTTDNLRHALKMGGLANPSLAVYDTERGLSTRTFGEVALIAPRDLVDANTGRHKGTYNRDSWSPVYPRIAYDLTEKGHDLMRELDKKRGEREGSLHALHDLVMEEPNILDKDYFTKLLSVDQQIKELYRSESPSIPFDQYVEKIAEPILNERREMLYAGQNPDGSKRYVPHTLENVSKVMNEDFSKIAPWDLFMESLVDLSEKYKSLESIRRHENRMAGMDDSLYKKVEREFHNLAEELVSDKTETMYPAEPAKKLQALIVNNDNRYGRPLTVTEEARVSALREQMKALPTDYFETKVDRPVGLSEFVEAVVPEGTSPELVAELEKSGLKVSTYDSTKDGAMNEAVLSAMDRADATDRGVRFRTGEQNIEEVNRTFNEELEKYVSSSNHTTLQAPLTLGMPSSVLLSCGLPLNEITLPLGVIKKALVKHHLKLADLRNLPKALIDPLLVYEWGSKARSMIIVTDLNVGDNKLTVAIKIERGGRILEINEIASIHDKVAGRFLEDMTTATGGGLSEALRYVRDKKKALDWLGIAPPRGASAQANPKLSDIANVINGFENPKIEKATHTDPKLRFRRAERAGDVSGAAEAAIDFVRNATPKNTTVDDVLRFLRVYHNSPHLLKKADGSFVEPETGERLGFDHRFMGSGEGAQAHGWGSYFSVKDLADYASTYDPSVYHGMRITQNDEYVISNGGNAKTSELLFETVYGLCKSCETAPDEDAIKRYVIETITSRFQEHQQEANRQRRLLDALKDNEPWAVTVTNAQAGDIITDPKTGYRYSEEDSSVDYVRWRYEISKKMEGRYGKVLSFTESNPDYVEHFVAKVERHKYAVEIPDPDTNHYIREDRRLTKHEEEMIRKAINDKWELRDSVLAKRSWRGITGKEAYEDLSLALGAKQASLLFNEAGFVGIHYNGSQDGECYVIFNENDAKITDHYRFRRTERTDPKSMIDPINPQWDGEWYSPEDLTGKSTADLLELPAAPATPEKRPTQSVAEYAETMSRHYADARVRFRTGAHKKNLRAPQPPRITDGMSLYEVAQLQHEYNRNYRDYLSSSMKRMDALVTTKGRFIRYMVDSARPVELFCKEMERMGIGMTPEQNVYQDLMTQSSRELNIRKQEVEPLVTKLTDRIRDLREQKLLDKVMDVSYTFTDGDTEITEKVERADGYDKVSLYFQAKDIVECEQLGLVSRGREGFEDVVTEFGKSSNHITPEAYIASFEAAVGKANAEALCDDMRKMSRWSIDRLHGAGLMTDDQYRSLTQSPRRYYAPQRGFKVTEESDRNAYERVEMTAEGRQSLSGDPIAYMQAIMNTTVMRVVRNQDLLHLYEWVTQHQQELARRGVLEIGETYYRKAGVDEKGNPIYTPSKQAPTIEELRHDADARRQIAKLRMDQKRLDQSNAKGETADYVYKVKSKEISDKISDLNNSIEILYRDPKPLRGNENEQDEALRRTVKVYKDGVEQQIHFSPQYRGELVADVLNGRPSIDKNSRFYQSGWGEMLEKTGQIKFVSKATRFMSALMTQYNPNFAVTNALRDYGTALISNVSDFGWDYQRAFMANYAKVQKTVLKYAMSDAYSDGTYPSGKYGTYLKEFFDEGAATGWSFLPDVVKIRQTMKEMSDPSLKQKLVNGKFGVANAFGLKQGIGMITEASELNTRFAEYVTSRERGYSKKEAAKHAKELTVNFNRKGALAGVFGSFFGFWNASIQGTNKIVRLGKPAAEWCGTLFAGGLAQAMLYALIDPDKDDERAFTEWEMMTNLCMGDVKIPLPQGFRGFWGAGVQMALAIAGKKDWQESVIDGMQFLMGELLPNEVASLTNVVEWDDVTGNVTLNSKQVARDVMPTSIQPVTDVFLNMDFMGNQVYYEPFVKNQEGQVAQRTLGKKRTKQVYKDLSDKIWYAMGGSLERNDRMSRNGTNSLPDGKLFNPSVIEHVFEGYTTGVGRTLADIATCVSAASNGDPSELRKLQIVNVLTKQEKDYSDSDRSYWKLMDFSRSRQQTMSNLRKAKEGEDLERYREMTRRVSELAPRMTGEQLTEKIWEDGTEDEKLYVTWLETKALLKQIDKGTVTKEEVAPTIDRLTEQFRELR